MSNSKHTGKYQLVEFEEDEGRTVAIVPQNWLKFTQKKCWWPNGKSDLSTVINCKEPDPRNGTYCSFVKILAASDDYQKLRRTEDQCLDVSDIATETETDCESQPRNIRAPARYRHDTATEDIAIDDERSQVMTPPETCRLPNIMIERSTSQRRRNSQSPPPKRRIFSTDERRSGSPPSRSGASFSKRSGYGGESFRGDGRRQSPSPGRIGASTESFRSERRSRSPPRRGASTESFRSERRSQSPPRRGTSSESFRSKRRSRSPPRSGASTESFRGERRSQSPPSRSGASFGYGGESFRGDGRRQNQNLTLEQLQPFFGKVFLRFSELKGHLNALDDRLDRLEAAQVHAGQPGPRRQPPPRLPEGQYPVTTVEALVQLDQGLSNDEAMGSAVQYLSAIGGADLKKVIKNIIEKLMCPRLAVSYTLTGRNKDKGKLQDLPHFLDTVYKAAKVRFPEASLVELNSLMGYCLTRNCDRGGQKQEKEEKKKREREEREGEERERNDQQ